MTDPARKKHVILLLVGIFSTIIAQCFGIPNPNAYTVAAIALLIFGQPIAYFIILGAVSLVVAAIRRNVKKYWFPLLAWLFLFAGLFDVAGMGYTRFVLQPQIDQGVQEILRKNKMEATRRYAIGQVVTANGRSVKVVGYDTDGEPMVELVK